MLKCLGFITGEIILIVVVLVLFPSIIITERQDIFDESGRQLLPLESKYYYSQELTNSQKSLNSISLQLKNPLILNNDRIEVGLKTKDGQSLQDFIFYGSNIGDPSWLKLNFSPISASPILIHVSSTNITRDSLYLIGSTDHQFNLKTTYRAPSFFTRFSQEIDYQFSQFSLRSHLHTLVYISVILLLNLLLIL